MMPGVLSRYIARRFTATLMLIVFAVGAVIFLVKYVDVLRGFSDDKGFNAMLGLRLALMHVPLLLDTALPFVFLFGALLSLLGLSRKLELVVARASGVSVWGFLRAPFAVALILGTLATGVLNPLAIRLQEQAANKEAEISGKASWGSGHWFRQEGKGGPSIVYAASAGTDSLELFGVTAFVFNAAGKFKEKVIAPRASYERNRWILTDATAVSAASAPHIVARYELPTDLSAGELKRSFVEPKAISVWALPDFISTAKRMGLNPERFRVEFHTLVNRPVLLLAMVMIAATVSLRLTRYGGTWRLVLTGAGIGFLLYALSEIAGDLGGNGIIDPVLAAWLPPLVALTFGATALLFQEDG
jgi:lipopolysaccharide export system permease protein